MSERDIVARTGSRPATIDSLARDLDALGLRAGATVIVHSSLGAMAMSSAAPAP